MQMVVNVVAVLLVALGLSGALVMRKSDRPTVALKVFVGSMLSVNGLVALVSLGLAFVALAYPVPVLAQGGTTTTSSSTGGAEMGAALATGLACIGAGIAVGIAGAAAIGGITEKPEILGRTLIFVGLAEGIAIYGLIISFMILNR
jgi:V/A-type H+-transporting ATPase subunit K